MQKYVVLKMEDIQAALTDTERDVLVDIVHRIMIYRDTLGKPFSNDYVVVNQDEPYSDDVIAILTARGHWE